MTHQQNNVQYLVFSTTPKGKILHGVFEEEQAALGAVAYLDQVLHSWENEKGCFIEERPVYSDYASWLNARLRMELKKKETERAQHKLARQRRLKLLNRISKESHSDEK